MCLQHESYVAVRGRQDIEFACGVDLKDFLLGFIMNLSSTHFLVRTSLNELNFV